MTLAPPATDPSEKVRAAAAELPPVPESISIVVERGPSEKLRAAVPDTDAPHGCSVGIAPPAESAVRTSTPHGCSVSISSPTAAEVRHAFNAVLPGGVEMALAVSEASSPAAAKAAKVAKAVAKANAVAAKVAAAAAAPERGRRRALRSMPMRLSPGAVQFVQYRTVQHEPAEPCLTSQWPDAERRPRVGHPHPLPHPLTATFRAPHHPRTN